MKIFHIYNLSYFCLNWASATKLGLIRCSDSDAAEQWSVISSCRHQSSHLFSFRSFQTFSSCHGFAVASSPKWAWVVLRRAELSQCFLLTWQLRPQLSARLLAISVAVRLIPVSLANMCLVCFSFLNSLVEAGNWGNLLTCLSMLHCFSSSVEPGQHIPILSQSFPKKTQ